MWINEGSGERERRCEAVEEMVFNELQRCEIAGGVRVHFRVEVEAIGVVLMVV